MANTFFQFKQFTIQQQNCAMKVSTDSCIFGALAAEKFAEKILMEKETTRNFLDIGTGTGLLSLMLAQKTGAFIDAVEIDTAAFTQAAENFLSSPFSEKISIFNEDILKYDSTKKYDGIVCNPPFFEGDLKSSDKSKNVAKHDATLTLLQLIKKVESLLKPNGIFAVLLPFNRVQEFINEAFAVNIFLQHKILLRHTLNHPYFRGVLFFSTLEIPITTIELIIKEPDQQYTSAFIELMKSYYLHL